MVISLNSLFSIFATHGACAIIFGNDQSEKREERENIPCGSLRMPRLISLNSLFSYFAWVLPIAGKVPQNSIAAPCFTAILHLQYPALSPTASLPLVGTLRVPPAWAGEWLPPLRTLPKPKGR